jgi:hypothetical protein
MNDAKKHIGGKIFKYLTSLLKGAIINNKTQKIPFRSCKKVKLSGDCSLLYNIEAIAPKIGPEQTTKIKNIYLFLLDIRIRF